MRFDLLTDYTIPYLHPLAVHFPLVLLLLAAGVAAAYAASGAAVWRQATLGLLLLGTAASWWAGETGETLESAVEGEPLAEAVLDTHEAMAEWTLRLALLASVAVAGATLAVRRRSASGAPAPVAEPLWARATVLVLAVGAAVLVAWTAHLGGIMVWGVPASP